PPPAQPCRLDVSPPWWRWRAARHPSWCTRPLGWLAQAQTSSTRRGSPSSGARRG
ncbi:unnamed protein product, partial [Prorocentrum cordatum]